MAESGPLEIIDVVQPCPHCGAACLGQVHFRSLSSDVTAGRRELRTDRITFDGPLGAVVEQALDKGDYAGLPDFVRAWNEDRGWATFDSDGGPVAAAELLATADLTLAVIDPHTVNEDVWASLRGFVEREIEAGTSHVWALNV